MSYKSRERKRRAKIAVAAAKREHSTTIERRYYLTVAKRACRCAACGGKLRAEADIVYRHDRRLTLCVPCADRDPLVTYRPSLRWSKRRLAGRRKLRPC